MYKDLEDIGKNFKIEDSIDSYTVSLATLLMKLK